MRFRLAPKSMMTLDDLELQKFKLCRNFALVCIFGRQL